MYGATGETTNGYGCRGRLYRKCCVLWKRQGLGMEHLEGTPWKSISGNKGQKGESWSSKDEQVSVEGVCVERKWAILLKGRPELHCGSSWWRKLFILLQETGSWVGKWFDDGDLFNLGGTSWFTKIVMSRVVLARCLGLYLGSFTLSLTVGNSLYLCCSFLNCGKGMLLISMLWGYGED